MARCRKTTSTLKRELPSKIQWLSSTSCAPSQATLSLSSICLHLSKCFQTSWTAIGALYIFTIGAKMICIARWWLEEWRDRYPSREQTNQTQSKLQIMETYYKEPLTRVGLSMWGMYTNLGSLSVTIFRLIKSCIQLLETLWLCRWS